MGKDYIFLTILLICLILTTACAPASTSKSITPPLAIPIAEKTITIATTTAADPPPSPTAGISPSIPTAIPPTTTPDVPAEAFTFTTEDGIDIAATLFGDGDLGVLLLHMGKGTATGNNQIDWHPLARYLAEQGYSVLTPDFRSRASSEGEFVNDPLMLYAQAGFDFMRQRGISRFVCIGAGVGGPTCMYMALTKDLEGLVSLSSSLQTRPTNRINESDLARLSMPKLFLYGERDGFGFPEAMENIYRYSARPKALFACDTAAHGSDLLYGPCGEDIHQQILEFLDSMGEAAITPRQRSPAPG